VRGGVVVMGGGFGFCLGRHVGVVEVEVVVRKEVFPEVGCICIWLDVRKNVVDADVDL
jgi:hypothetical protein